MESADDFEGVVRAHQAKVLGLCLSFLTNPAAAEDAAQEVFVKAFRARDKFRAEAALSTWLYRIAVNHCLNLLRNEKLRKTQSWDELIAQRGEEAQALWTTPEAGVDAERLDLIIRLLSGIPEDERRLLLLREAQGFSYEEISEILEISLDAVKSRLRRARARLQERTQHFFPASRVQTDEPDKPRRDPG